ncbi:hypothetical protein BJP36_43515 [Moorena producens JHB]|uniref:Uncharacterized protein n=1 Tax=Moorena producens (strain JHB) TaxID=1454205 RepID=A0A9Q9UVV7_MOOP1|nr:hypothetical protein [Moorena producens]WAN69231.1 hypothetical protein BJP36_43515 [Moorena producens JHB]
MNRSRVGILPAPRDQGTGKMPIPPVAPLPTPYGALSVMASNPSPSRVAPLPTPFDIAFITVMRYSILGS